MKSPKWTFEEEYILEKYYWSRGAKGCQDLGINRSLHCIHNRASFLGIKNSRVRQVEARAIILKHYELGGSTACQAAGLQNWSRERIHNYARILGITYLSLRSICADWNVIPATVERRLKAGMSLYAALTARTHRNAPRRGIIRGIQQHDARL